MNGLLVAAVSVVIAFVISGALYESQGDKSDAVGALLGLLSNVFYISVGVFLILGGGRGRVVGVAILIVVFYLARGNSETLKEENIRAKIAGQR
jgi:hypothetical protein